MWFIDCTRKLYIILPNDLQNHQAAIIWIITSGISYFWKETKLYKAWLKNPFKSEEKMIPKIKSVFMEWPSNLVGIRKSMKKLPGKLPAVKECSDSSIKMHSGQHFSSFCNTLFCHCFYHINNLHCLISLNIFCSLDISFFFSICFFDFNFIFFNKHVEIKCH